MSIIQRQFPVGSGPADVQVEERGQGRAAVPEAKKINIDENQSVASGKGPACFSNTKNRRAKLTTDKLAALAGLGPEWEAAEGAV